MELHAVPPALPPQRSGRSDGAGRAATGSPGLRAGEAKEGALAGAGCLDGGLYGMSVGDP